MKDQTNLTFTLSSFYASNIKFNVKTFGDSTIVNELVFSLKTTIQKIDNNSNQFSITYKVNLANKGESLTLVCDFHAIFNTADPVNEEILNSDIIKINATAIGFPFLRSFISQLSINAGLPPIILPTINFTKFK